jgi:hypothetical protein
MKIELIQNASLIITISLDLIHHSAFQNENTTFREQPLLPSERENSYFVGPEIWISPFSVTQDNRYFHLKMGAESSSET